MIWIFTLVFGFSMGADYMLIPLVVAECFGTRALGKLLALIIMGYSLGQWAAPWMVGRIYDARHSYDLAWTIMGGAGLIGALAIYVVTTSLQDSLRNKRSANWMTRGPFCGLKTNPKAEPSPKEVSGSPSRWRLNTLNISARNWSPTRSVRLVFFTIPKFSPPPTCMGPRAVVRNGGEFP